MAVFLQLPPQMGGLTFGPFDGIVHLGTDARRCQVVLDSSQGIYPIHATLAPADGKLHFGPADLQAKCFVIQSGSPQVWPVQGPVEVSIGDAIVLGTPAGPRFQIMDATGHKKAGPSGIQQALSQVLPAGAARRVNQRSMSQGIADEVQRRAQAEMLRYGPMRELYYLRQRIRTGSLFNPVTIVGAMMTIGSMILAGGVSCSGLLLALWQKFTY